MGLVTSPQATTRSRHWLAVPALMTATIISIAVLVDYSTHQQVISQAITLDLVLTIPLVYWLIIRKTTIPNVTVVPVFIAGLLIAGTVLAPADQALLVQIRTWVLPVVEISVITFIVYRVIVFRRRYRSGQDQDRDVFSLLRRTASEFVPARLAYMLATELAVFYYLLLTWKKPVLSSGDFTSHKKSGTVPILAALVLMIVVEAAALHFLLAMWSPLAAWIFTGLSAYAALQVGGMARSLSRRFISVNQSEITLRSGILSEASVPLHLIKSFGPSTLPVDSISGGVNLSPLAGIEKANFVIHLTDCLEMSGLYGKKHTYSSIAFYVDDCHGLNDTLRMLAV